jgi:hypothetical protein
MLLTETAIANRAIGLLGASDYIAAGALRTENSRNAIAILNVYDQDRQAELRRNVWRFAIRTTALRPIGWFSKFLTFATWLVGTTYAVNDVVVGSDGNTYFSLLSGNLGNDPTSTTGKWTLYFGNLVAQEFVMAWSATITYDTGHHTIGSDGQAYTSLVNANLNHNPVGDGGVHWVLTSSVTDGDADDSTAGTGDDIPNIVTATLLSFYSGEVVYVGRNVYLSKVNANDDLPGAATTNEWLLFTALPALSSFNFIYPIGTGPEQQDLTKNAYRLPNGFLREAPQDPKAGATLFLGAPSALPYNDWNFENQFITTRDSGVLLFRFVADIMDPTMFDPMFSVGLAHRLAEDCCQAITQSDAKQAALVKSYDKVMSEARIVNGIETGAYQPPEDDYISCRI